MSIYDYKIIDNNGNEISMSIYRGKVLLIVNTASKCGFTPQYNELQSLYEQYNENGLEILAFPCNQFMNQEPGTKEEISRFCTLNFGITFPIMAKVDVNGENAHPLFKYLKENSSGIFGKSIKWNFTKFIIDPEGNIVGRFAPTMTPSKLTKTIEDLLKGVK